MIGPWCRSNLLSLELDEGSHMQLLRDVLKQVEESSLTWHFTSSITDCIPYAAECGSPAGGASRHAEDLIIGFDLIECRRPISR